MSAAQPSEQERGQSAIRVTLIGSVIDLLLGVMKIVIGSLSGSLALVSDGIHSLSDLLTDGFVLVLARISQQGPDHKHPYGHGRFEALGTLVISTALFTVAGAIAYDSVRRLLSHDTLDNPGWAAFLVTLASIASKEWIFRYTRHVAQETRSSMLMANAWHSRTDALSSIVVLVGLAGVWLGFPWMDWLAAFIVAGMIMYIAWTLLASSLTELVDSSVDDTQRQALESCLQGLPGVIGVHELRARPHGGQLLLDVHLQVDKRISVSEGHHIGDLAMARLKEAFPEVSDLVLHIDPELDMDKVEGKSLPARAEVEEQLFAHWSPHLYRQDCDQVILHYVNDGVEVVLLLKAKAPEVDLKELEAATAPDWLHGIRLYRRH